MEPTEEQYAALAEQAEDPRTPPETLSGIYHEMERQGEGLASRVRDALLRHPNAPLELLEALLGYHCSLTESEALLPFVQNPALPLLPLEAPEFLEGFSNQLLGRLLSYAALPASAVALLSNHPEPEVAKVARQHVRVAGEAKPDWGKELPPLQRSDAAPSALEWAREELARLDAWPDWMPSVPLTAETTGYPPIERIPEALSIPALGGVVLPETPLSPPPGGWKALRKLERSARIVQARRVVLPPEALMVLAEDPFAGVQRALVCNISTPAEALHRICERKNEQIPIREYLTVHPNTTPATLLRLLQTTFTRDDYHRYLYRILHRPDMSPAFLADLALSEDPVIRQAVRRHPMARSAEGALLPEIKQTLRRTVLRLTSDSSSYRSYDAEEIERSILYVSLAHPESPPESILAAVHSHDWRERLAVARNSALPREILERLATDEGDRFVRAAARENLAARPDSAAIA